MLNFTVLGWFFIAAGWLIQMTMVWLGKNKIQIWFLILYILGSALILSKIFPLDLSGWLNVLILVFSVGVLIKVR